MTAMNDTSRECGGGVVEPGELEGWGWELGSVLRDCARCWENVLGSSEEGLSRTERRGLGSDWVCPLHLGGEQYSKALQLWILMNFLELACVSLVA